MNIYKQIDTTSDPKIIGGRDDMPQIKIDKKELEQNGSYEQYKFLFTEIGINHRLTNIDYIESISFKNLKGQFSKKIIHTDLMSFFPAIIGCKYIVSEKFVKALIKNGVNKNNYSIKKISIKGESQSHYLFFVPYILLEDIDYKNSLIYIDEILSSKPTDYFSLNSYEEFIELRKKHTFLKFEQIALDSKYKERSIIAVQGSVHYFFKEGLIENILDEKITNFFLREPKEQKLIFV